MIDFIDRIGDLQSITSTIQSRHSSNNAQLSTKLSIVGDPLSITLVSNRAHHVQFIKNVANTYIGVDGRESDAGHTKQPSVSDINEFQESMHCFSIRQNPGHNGLWIIDLLKAMAPDTMIGLNCVTPKPHLCIM